jgi:hypothetical protein
MKLFKSSEISIRHTKANSFQKSNNNNNNNNKNKSEVHFVGVL